MLIGHIKYVNNSEALVGKRNQMQQNVINEFRQMCWSGQNNVSLGKREGIWYFPGI